MLVNSKTAKKIKRCHKTREHPSFSQRLTGSLQRHRILEEEELINIVRRKGPVKAVGDSECQLSFWKSRLLFHFAYTVCSFGNKRTNRAFMRLRADLLGLINRPCSESTSSSDPWRSPLKRADKSLDKVHIQIKLAYKAILKMERSHWTVAALEINCKWEETSATHSPFRSRKESMKGAAFLYI